MSATQDHKSCCVGWVFAPLVVLISFLSTAHWGIFSVKSFLPEMLQHPSSAPEELSVPPCPAFLNLLIVNAKLTFDFLYYYLTCHSRLSWPLFFLRLIIGSTTQCLNWGEGVFGIVNTLNVVLLQKSSHKSHFPARIYYSALSPLQKLPQSSCKTTVNNISRFSPSFRSCWLCQEFLTELLLWLSPVV